MRFPSRLWMRPCGKAFWTDYWRYRRPHCGSIRRRAGGRPWCAAFANEPDIKGPDIGVSLEPMKPKKTHRVLAIDVGGSHVKMRVSTHRDMRQFVSGPDLTAKQMVAHVHETVGDWSFTAVSIGYPGIVIHGKIVTEPHNLGHGWVGYDFHEAFGRPTRIINDAAMQAIGSYRGGRMLFLGLGTGMGSAMVVDGVVESMELAHLNYKKGKTYEDYVGDRGRTRLGPKKWRHAVDDIVGQLRIALEADYVVLGGGNARKLKKLPKGARLGNNDFAFIGGFRLWQPGGIFPAARGRRAAG
jgi:polyphosphate glucokinase